MHMPAWSTFGCVFLGRVQYFWTQWPASWWRVPIYTSCLHIKSHPASFTQHPKEPPCTDPSSCCWYKHVCKEIVRTMPFFTYINHHIIYMSSWSFHGDLALYERIISIARYYERSFIPSLDPSVVLFNHSALSFAVMFPLSKRSNLHGKKTRLSQKPLWNNILHSKHSMLTQSKLLTASHGALKFRLFLVLVVGY